MAWHRATLTNTGHRVAFKGESNGKYHFCLSINKTNVLLTANILKNFLETKVPISLSSLHATRLWAAKGYVVLRHRPRPACGSELEN